MECIQWLLQLMSDDHVILSMRNYLHFSNKYFYYSWCCTWIPISQSFLTGFYSWAVPKSHILEWSSPFTNFQGFSGMLGLHDHFSLGEQRGRILEWTSSPSGIPGAMGKGTDLRWVPMWWRWAFSELWHRHRPWWEAQPTADSRQPSPSRLTGSLCVRAIDWTGALASTSSPLR